MLQHFEVKSALQSQSHQQHQELENGTEPKKMTARDTNSRKQTDDTDFLNLPRCLSSLNVNLYRNIGK